MWTETQAAWSSHRAGSLKPGSHPCLSLHSVPMQVSHHAPALFLNVSSLSHLSIPHPGLIFPTWLTLPGLTLSSPSPNKLRGIFLMFTPEPVLDLLRTLL